MVKKQPSLRKMANRKFLKPNQFPSSIQSPASSPNDYTTYLFTNIFLQFDNEWLFFIPNFFHSLISAISNFFHSILSWLYVIPNFFHTLVSSIANLFHSIFSIIPNLFHSLNSAITTLFHSLVSWLSVIPNLFTNLFHSLVSWLSVIPNLFTNLFHSLLSEITNLFHSLVYQITNLFHSIFSIIPNLFHSLNSAITNLFHIVITVLGVVFLCLFCYYCWTAITACMTWLASAVMKLISGLFRLLGEICNICGSCSRNSYMIMTGPGTNGIVLILRAVFESNPRAYFCNLRASKSDHNASCGNEAVSSSDQNNIITDRQKIKETDEYKLAMAEELAARQQQLLIQAEEARRLRKRKKADMRKMMNERRQKQRVEEIRQIRRKDEENLNLKEKHREEIKKELHSIEATCSDMASLLRCLGIHVGGVSPNEVQAAYKRACLKFHPDRMSTTDLRQQVEAEEKFKLISSMKIFGKIDDT